MNRRELIAGALAATITPALAANRATYEQEELWAADGAWQKFLQGKLEFAKAQHVGPHTDREYARAMQEVAAPIMRITTRESLDWRIGVVDADQIVNACTYGGGVILMFSGIVKLCQSEVELAAVIAHEVGHVEYRHSIQRLMAIDLFRKSGFGPNQDASTVAKKVFMDQYDQVAPELAWRSYRRQAEYQADAHSVNALAQTGYDVNQAHVLFERLMLKFPQSEKVDNCLISSHPLAKERVARIKGLARRHRKHRGPPRNGDAFQYMKSISG